MSIKNMLFFCYNHGMLNICTVEFKYQQEWNRSQFCKLHQSVSAIKKTTENFEEKRSAQPFDSDC